MKIGLVLKTLASATALALSVVGGSSASATTIDFTTQTPGVITGSIGGVSFASSGGPGGAPNIGNVFNMDAKNSLNNGTYNASYGSDYPTASILDVIFASPTNNVSFMFNNFGGGNGAFYRALDAAGNLVSTGALDFGGDSYNPAYSTFNVSGSGISTLEFNNNQDAYNSWEFGISSLSYDASAPTGPGAPAPLVGGGLLSALAALMALATTRFGRRAGTFA